MRSANGFLAVALALAASLPPLGQQRRLEVLANAPGERLTPRPLRDRRRPTPADLERLELAQGKRERKARRQWLNHQRSKEGSYTGLRDGF